MNYIYEPWYLEIGLYSQGLPTFRFMAEAERNDYKTHIPADGRLAQDVKFLIDTMIYLEFDQDINSIY